MISDMERGELYSLIAQIVDDRLRARIDALLAARGLNLGNTDGAGEGELWAAGGIRTAGGLAVGETGYAPSQGSILAKEISPPAPPAAGCRLIYPKSDGWYEKDSAGSERKLTNV